MLGDIMSFAVQGGVIKAFGIEGAFIICYTFMDYISR